MSGVPARGCSSSTTRTSIIELVATALRYEGFEVDDRGRRARGPGRDGRDVPARPGGARRDAARPRRLRGPAAGCAPTASRVPVVFLTARDATEDKVAGLTVGGDDYVTKPFSLEELVARVGPSCGGPAAARTPARPAALRRPGAGRGHATRCGAAARPSSSPPPSSTCCATCCSTRGGCCRRRRSSTTSGSTTSAATPTWSRPTSATCARRSTPSSPPLIHTIRGVGYTLRLPDGSRRSRVAPHAGCWLGLLVLAGVAARRRRRRPTYRCLQSFLSTASTQQLAAAQPSATAALDGRLRPPAPGPAGRRRHRSSRSGRPTASCASGRPCDARPSCAAVRRPRSPTLPAGAFDRRRAITATVRSDGRRPAYRVPASLRRRHRWSSPCPLDDVEPDAAPAGLIEVVVAVGGAAGPRPAGLLAGAARAAAAARHRGDRRRHRRRRPRPAGSSEARAPDRGRPARPRPQRDARPDRGGLRRARRVGGPAAPLRGRRLPRAAHAAHLRPRLRRAVPPRRRRAPGGPRPRDAPHRDERPAWACWSTTCCCWPASTRAARSSASRSTSCAVAADAVADAAAVGAGAADHRSTRRGAGRWSWATRPAAPGGRQPARQRAAAHAARTPPCGSASPPSDGDARGRGRRRRARARRRRRGRARLRALLPGRRRRGPAAQRRHRPGALDRRRHRRAPTAARCPPAPHPAVAAPTSWSLCPLPLRRYPHPQTASRTARRPTNHPPKPGRHPHRRSFSADPADLWARRQPLPVEGAKHES